MGALEVTRSYGSCGLIDVRAAFPDHVRSIQVKGRKIGLKELVQLKQFAAKNQERSHQGAGLAVSQEGAGGHRPKLKLEPRRVT
ncbi:MAG: hypothetical protein HYU39_08565 [Thaumarchaeota archaeon]|nr:hypothetical protein [Nitrososphaerota archaeon]